MVHYACHHEGREQVGVFAVTHGAEHVVTAATTGYHADKRAACSVGRGGVGKVELRQLTLAVDTDRELVGKAENGAGEAIF